MDIPTFKTQKELFTWLKENEEDMISFKKASFKKADAFSAPATTMIDGGSTFKSLNKADVSGDVTQVKARLVINTTYIRDSHKDVHINGLWKKNLAENSKRVKHLQEHEMKFDKIIADKDDLKVFTKVYSWRDLGYDVDGKTEALVFDSVIKESRNPSMFREYKNENVDQHSVGMYYVNMKLAFDSKDEDDVKYKEEFDKHIELIANKDEVRKDGYFWAVYEAKVIEGSAVPLGSNHITPTIQTSKEPISNEQKDVRKEALIEWLKKV